VADLHEKGGEGKGRAQRVVEEGSRKHNRKQSRVGLAFVTNCRCGSKHESSKGGTRLDNCAAAKEHEVASQGKLSG